jgi:hypothetical protein
MTCAAAAVLSDLLRDGRLSPARAAQVRAHLESCAKCKGLHADAPPLARTAKTAAMPASLKARLKQSLAARAEAPSEGPGLRPVLGAALRAFALAAAALSLIWLLHAGTASLPLAQGDLAGEPFVVRSLP